MTRADGIRNVSYFLQTSLVRELGSLINWAKRVLFPMPRANKVFCGSSKTFSVEKKISIKFINLYKPEACPPKPCITLLLCTSARPFINSWTCARFVINTRMRKFHLNLLSRSKTFNATPHLTTPHFATLQRLSTEP